MKKLDVIYCGWGEHWQLGTLADNGRDVLFEYSAQALERNLELSAHMLPLRVAAYGGMPTHLERLPGLVYDALPDGWGLLLMDKMFARAGMDLSRISPLDRLAFLGHRAMGALSFEPASGLEVAVEDIKLLEIAKQAQDIVAGRDVDALKTLVLVGGSPHGARPKALVHRRPSGLMSTVASDDSSPWLIKFPAERENKEVCAIEHLYAKMARECGLDVPQTEYFELGNDLAAFGIARFDIEGKIRVPMHTLAGALHADFRKPCVGAESFLMLTRKICGNNEAEVEKAYGRVVFNVVFNNRDDHSKNFSFRLSSDGQWALAPCYDITYCRGPGGEHQMDVCGEGRNVGRQHLLELAQRTGIDQARAIRVMDQVAHVASTLRSAISGQPIRKDAAHEIVGVVDQNVKRVSAAVVAGKRKAPSGMR